MPTDSITRRIPTIPRRHLKWLWMLNPLFSYALVLTAEAFGCRMWMPVALTPTLLLLAHMAFRRAEEDGEPSMHTMFLVAFLVAFVGGGLLASPFICEARSNAFSARLQAFLLNQFWITPFILTAIFWLAYTAIREANGLLSIPARVTLWSLGAWGWIAAIVVIIRQGRI